MNPTITFLSGGFCVYVRKRSLRKTTLFLEESAIVCFLISVFLLSNFQIKFRLVYARGVQCLLEGV